MDLESSIFSILKLQKLSLLSENVLFLVVKVNYMPVKFERNEKFEISIINFLTYFFYLYKWYYKV